MDNDRPLGGRRNLLHLSLALALPASAWAQSRPAASKAWPARPVTLVVPFPAGGASALMGKHLAAAFERQTQHSLRLDHRGGSGGLNGASYAASAPHDGYHLLLGGSNLVRMRALMPAADFDVLEEMRPVGLLGSMPQVVLVNPSTMRSRTAMEWLMELRRKPARYRMATAGVGSSSHIAAEVLRQQEELHFEFVHFRGSGPALQDLLAGSVDTMVDGLASCLPMVRSGRLKALLVTGQQRSPLLPDVPSAVEMGVDALDWKVWYGLFAPKDLSPAVMEQITHVLRRVEADSTLQQSYADMGIQSEGRYGTDFAKMVFEQTLWWAQRLKTLGVQNLQPRDGDDPLR